MGIFDKAKELASENADKINDAVEKAKDFADEKTGGKYTDKLDKAGDFVREQTQKAGDRGDSSPGA